MKITVKELAEQMDVDLITANSLMKAAVKTGQAKEVDKVKSNPNGKGKPSTVYEIPDTITFNIKRIS